MSNGNGRSLAHLGFYVTKRIWFGEGYITSDCQEALGPLYLEDGSAGNQWEEESPKEPLHFGFVPVDDLAPEVLARHAEEFKVLGERVLGSALTAVPPGDAEEDGHEDYGEAKEEDQAVQVHG